MRPRLLHCGMAAFAIVSRKGLLTTYPSMETRAMIVRRFVTALLATLPLGATHAAIFCPANETELRQALATAATNNEDDDIRLRKKHLTENDRKRAMRAA